MSLTFLEQAIDHALAQHPEAVKADVLKMMRRQAELEAEVAAYRRRYGVLRDKGQ
jgi:hypothetical protein